MSVENSITIKSKKLIERYIKNHKPIEWICKEANIPRYKFKKLFPEYKGSPGFNVKRQEKYGKVITEIKKCERCGKEFSISGRLNTKKFYKKRFCSVSCSKSRDKYWEKNASSYLTICWRYHKKKCIICDEDKIVAVHHYDHNHNNNDPANLIPLCPTHHHYAHSKYKELIKPKIEEYIKKFKGD